MEKQLKFLTSGLIKSYQYYAYPINIILSKYNKQEDKLLLNFFTNVFRGKSMQYYESNYQKWDCFNIKKLTVYKNLFINQLMKLIDDNIYIHITKVNEYYIPNRRAFNKYNYIHDLLVIGYNKLEETFLIAGFNENNNFMKTEVKFTQMLSSCFYESNYTELILISVKENYNYIINTNKIKKELKRYISCEVLNMSEYKLDEYTFGFDAYKKLNKDLKLYSEGNTDSMPGIIQDIYFIYEHKQIIYYKLQYLCTNNIIPLDILEEFSLIKEESNIIKNLFIKFIITKNSNYIKRISLRLDSLLKKEEKILKKLNLII